MGYKILLSTNRGSSFLSPRTYKTIRGAKKDIGLAKINKRYKDITAHKIIKIRRL